jgi:cytochrome c peroxidase
MIWNLKDAIKEMGKVQVGYKIKQTQKGKAFSVDIMPISLTNKDIDKIYTFFQTLKGEKPKIEYPQLPPSTLKTARPDEK